MTLTPFGVTMNSNPRSAAQEFCHGFGAGSHLKFFVNAPDVRVNGLVTDAEFFRDFLVEKSLREAIQYFLFAR